jgi:hypothetical protein
VQDATYLKALLAAIQPVQSIGQFDVERVARIADQYDAMVIDNLAETVAEFHRVFTAMRSGLRVIKGGIK